MEFAFCAETIGDRKPRELMTPSKQEGFFCGQLHFRHAGWGVWNCSAILRVRFHCLAAFTDPEGAVLISPRVRQFLMIGVCGGYTTFSSFSLQTLDFVRDGDWFKAFLNTTLSFSCCLGAVWLGRIVAVTLLPK